jgi:predicted SnoaL-like aldol condensation-catalyzing enzyme
MDDLLERNKRAVKEFYDLMFNQCKPREAIEKYAGAMYRQHNPHVADGKEAFIAISGRWQRSARARTFISKGYPPKAIT